MPTVPDHIAEGLRSIREGLHLRYNPRAKIQRAGEFDVHGAVLSEPVYDPRWEVWDKDPEGGEYKVMTVQGPDGSFRPPGEWLIELIQMVNPARYGGDVSRMVRAIVDDPNRTVTEVADEDFEDLIDQAVHWHHYAALPKTAVLADVR